MATDGMSLEEALAEGISSILNSVTVTAGGTMVGALEELLDPDHSTSGFGEYTKLSWQECTPGWIWNSWKDKDSGWQQVLTGGDMVGGHFIDLAEAIKAGAKSCEEQKKQCEKSNESTKK